MNLSLANNRVVNIKNVNSMAKLKGRRDGKAEKPAESWGKDSVPFISQAHAIFSAEAENRISLTRKTLNDRVYETLEREEQIILLESQKEGLKGKIAEAEERVKFFKSEIDGYKVENPMGRFARTRLIHDDIYWLVLGILIAGEILVTAPALVQLFGEGSWQSWVIAIAVGFLPVAGAHLLGTFLKSRLDRQNPQEGWIKKLFTSVFIVLLFAIASLAVLRAGITEGNLLNFNIVPKNQTKSFLILFFAAIQLAFFSVAIGLGFLHHSPAADSLRDAKKELKKLKLEETAIADPLKKYKSKMGLTEDEVKAKINALSSQVEVLGKELEIAVATYREANIHSRRDEINGGHTSLQAPDFIIDLDKFKDIFASLEPVMRSPEKTSFQSS
ncbi:MAG: hypothetical protein F2653_01060 [Actinobacteria bacterium]|uniref:Unannotated protein n=1 Tax=freshwater metagenome TaxID=449393 RepID=A0A6J6Z7G3_9ZZZZ|nr:hypothetical protein [Actinomycetota bacterium]MSW21784.1 hypothetical protein [Actinomycetota bacterium]MSX03594.1 hypothetical protein [Actinomycetota bacterium]MSX83934.1 hypothetical protein [Actinomycetota bacterium]MSY96012.1 hypothetical protein [Actinomycetota bacterium]